jgi:hypothetical protein
MGQQIAIRSDRARELVNRLAQRHGKSITATIEDALAVMDARDEAVIAERKARWRKAIEHDQALFRESGISFEIEDMYDEGGLPS